MPVGVARAAQSARVVVGNPAGALAADRAVVAGERDRLVTAVAFAVVHEAGLTVAFVVAGLSGRGGNDGRTCDANDREP